MSDGSRTPERKSLDYAESLGLNSVYEDAKTARNALDEVLTAVAESRDKKRALEAAKLDREMELAEEEAGRHPDMSNAAMERHLKVRYHKDEYLRELRGKLAGVIDDLDGLDLDRTMAETDIKIAVGRLNELGGYFQFMAVVKQASEARKASEAKSKDPWK